MKTNNISAKLKIIIVFVILLIFPNTINAEEKSQLDSWMPDKNLQQLVFKSLGSKVSSVDEITKEILEEYLTEIRLDDSYDNSKGLEYAKNLDSITLYSFNNKYLHQVDLSFLKNIQGNVMIELEQDGSYYLENGDLDKGFRKLLSLSNIEIATEYLTLGHNIYVDQNNYKKFSMNINDFYRPYYKEMDIEFDSDIALEFDFNDGHLIYDAFYNKELMKIDFILNETQSSNLSFDQISSEIQTAKIASDSITMSDNYYMHNQIDRLELEEFILAPSLKISTAKPVYVSYVDNNGKKLVKDDILLGVNNQKYESKTLEFKGYTLTKLPYNSSGIFKDTAQYVIYKYKKDITSNKPVEDPINKDKKPKQINEDMKDLPKTGNNHLNYFFVLFIFLSSLLYIRKLNTQIKK